MAGGINTYAYVEGNPVGFVDPTGEFAVAADIIIGGGILIVGAVMSPAGQKALKAAGNAIAELCKADDDDDNCDKKLDKGSLKVAGLFGNEHEAKADVLGTYKNLSKFDLCGCKDGRVVVKAYGCKGNIIGIVEGAFWK